MPLRGRRATRLARPLAFSSLTRKEVRVSAPTLATPKSTVTATEADAIYTASPTFQMACKQLESVAAVIDIDPNVLQRLARPRRAMVVIIPVRMDSGKTQVFTGDMGDYHRTRLTHTFEVASIARTIGRA